MALPESRSSAAKVSALWLSMLACVDMTPVLCSSNSSTVYVLAT